MQTVSRVQHLINTRVRDLWGFYMPYAPEWIYLEVEKRLEEWLYDELIHRTDVAVKGVFHSNPEKHKMDVEFMSNTMGEFSLNMNQGGGYFLIHCTFSGLVTDKYLLQFLYRTLPTESLDQFHPPPPKKDSNLKYEDTEFVELLQLIDWPSPPSSITNFNLSTNPKECWYELLSPRSIYRVGETLVVLITAKDHYGYVKSYGGDFFQAKLHSRKIKAGVTGHVTDLNNGTYLATFLLPWEGEAQVNIRLIHSSEAVSVLKDKRESRPDKVYFNGYFHFNGSSEVTECNIVVQGGDVCNYSDPVTGDTWQCLTPQKMPCHSLVYHSMGRYRRVTNSLEDALLRNSVTAQNINGAFTSIKIDPAINSTGLTSRLQVCSPGQEPSQPSGFYYNDIWTSLVCLGRHFPSPSDARACLNGKDIHMFGDSTLRQWFEYLERFIPSKKTNEIIE
ncbi:hypothetical protein XENTR_v10010190 [Xenopus tropicalis]|nr:hypothetical protein XENTR_v10010190 [Xenopus tropicalis]